MDISVNQPNLGFVYEVNLTIEAHVFDENESWLINHFHEMVTENNFITLNLFLVRNTNPTDDSHLRYKKIVAQYYVPNYTDLQKYFEAQAKKMRSQVVEKLGYHYSVSRRVLEHIETFDDKES